MKNSRNPDRSMTLVVAIFSVLVVLLAYCGLCEFAKLCRLLVQLVFDYLTAPYI